MRDLEKTLLGDFAVYPGHPITVGYLIIHKFSNFEQATSFGEGGFMAALEDGDIPGAGGNVNWAIDTLGWLKAGVDPMTVWDMAEDYWRDCCTTAYAKYYEPGADQAQQVREDFFAKACQWLQLEPQSRPDIRVLGEPLVWPGHPVAVALLLMDRYRSITEMEAFAPDEGQPRWFFGGDGLPVASTFHRIARGLLADFGHCSFEDAIVRAEADFDRALTWGVRGADLEGVKLQGERFRDVFKDRAIQWLELECQAAYRR
jgi:hypothetical protein